MKMGRCLDEIDAGMCDGLTYAQVCRLVAIIQL